MLSQTDKFRFSVTTILFSFFYNPKQNKGVGQGKCRTLKELITITDYCNGSLTGVCAHVVDHKQLPIQSLSFEILWLLSLSLLTRGEVTR